MRKRGQAQAQAGFTIVELLIVIVVIAILAAITIVAYNGIQTRTYDAVVRSDFSTIYKKLAMYKVEWGTYPYDPVSVQHGSGSQMIHDKLATIDMKLSTNSYYTSTDSTNLLYLASDDGQHFALLGYAIGNPTIYITDEVTVPEVYDNTGIIDTRYPRGNPGGIADKLGLVDISYYYIYTKNLTNQRGWGVWN
jgi:prepilin-type N-terminal cleavage/methylation domain-containing protein